MTLLLAFLPILTLITLWLIWLGVPRSQPIGLRLAGLQAVTVWAAALVLLTELLSLFNAINRAGLLGAWLALWIGLVVLRGRYALAGGQVVLRRLRELRWQWWEGLALLFVLVYGLALTLTAWFAAPNNIDSLFYHMSRVAHWTQNASIAHYPTALSSQLWQPPGAEYLLLHLFVLGGGDQLVNFVQLAALFGSCLVAGLIARSLGAGRWGQWLAALLVLTVPMAILQATSTQNDLVNGWWVLVTIYWVITAHQRELTWGDWVSLGLAVGLGALTKGTYYAYALPFLAWLLGSVLRRSGWRAALRAAVLGALLVALLNTPHWTRNQQTFGYLLGPADFITSLSNEAFGPEPLASNLSRNLAGQVVFPGSLARITDVLLDGVEQFHRATGISTDDPRTSLTGYHIVRSSASEDYTGNPFHLVLLGSVLIWLVIRRRQDPVLGIYGLVLVSTFVLFAILYKWQPWVSRLLLPFFLAAAPLMGQVLAAWRPRVLPGLILVGLLLLGLRPLLGNTTRPLVGTLGDGKTVLQEPRREQIFRNAPLVRDAYVELTGQIAASGCQDVGLLIGERDVEYPIWAILAPTAAETRIEHLTVADLAGRQPCALFVSAEKYPDISAPYEFSTDIVGYRVYFLPEWKQP